MVDKQLTLSQQIALLPAAIPDSILDFLEGLLLENPLHSELVRLSLDAEYLKTDEQVLIDQLRKLRAEGGALVRVNVDQAGREYPGAYLVKLGFEKGDRGVGIFIRLKERTILKLSFLEGEYNEEALKQLLKIPN